MLNRGQILVFALFVSTGCGHLKTRADLRSHSSHVHFEAERSVMDQTGEPRADVQEVPLHASTHIEPQVQDAESDAEILKIPVELNSHVQKWIDYFTKKDRARFQRFLDRGQTYRQVIETVLEENDLPAELYYLAMIESGFRTNARSHAAAVGVWQFIAGTGHRYGLRIDRWVDERQDPIRATEAAARYLRDLYNVFGSWHLAMGAYNAGEIRILRAVMKGRTRDFWELVRLGVLPKETANYVPKFLAVVTVAQEPSRYGFRVDSNTVSYPKLYAVGVPGGVTLANVAKVSKVPLADLKRVNPHLRSTAVPPGRSDYEIWFPVPEDRARDIRLSMKNLKPERHLAVVSKANRADSYHVVRRGENLSKIAQRYKMSVGHLKRINGLRNSRIMAGQKLRTQPSTYSPSRLVRYKVRRGDNLILIAKKFKTSPAKIKQRNGIRRDTIYVGQILRIERGS